MHPGPARTNIGPIRGIDYIVARAAVDAGITRDSPYGQFLGNALLACTPDMVRQLLYAFGMSILQTLQQSNTSAENSAPSGWLTSTLVRDTACECSIATDPTFGSVAVIRMPDYMAWMPAIEEPPRPMASGRSKSKTPGKHDGESEATPLWHKTTKAAAQQGQMVILCCVDQAGA
eukprot:16438283-Heterocapsa_arctica.AAC.1